MSTFPGISEEYLLDRQSLGQVYDFYLHSIETREGSIRESDFIAMGLSEEEITISEEELQSALMQLNTPK